MKLTVTLSKAQAEALQDHAKGGDLGEDLVRTWWGRTVALANYAGKLRSGDAEFRPYVSKDLSEEERERLKKMVGAKPREVKSKPRKPAPKAQVQALKQAAKVTQRAHKIALYDSPGVAMAKAKGDAATLRAAGRDKSGRRIK